jgi:excinuclease UvrABC ATPase subunit
MGPEGGDAGGTVVAEGTPHNLAALKRTQSHTAQALKEFYQRRAV